MPLPYWDAGRGRYAPHPVFRGWGIGIRSPVLGRQVTKQYLRKENLRIKKGAPGGRSRQGQSFLCAIQLASRHDLRSSDEI